MRDFKKDPLGFSVAADSLGILPQKSEQTSSSGIYLEGSSVEKYPAAGVVVLASKEAEELGYCVGDTVIYVGYVAEDINICGAVVDIVGTNNIVGKFTSL